VLASEREKMGSAREREPVVVKPHYRPRLSRLWRTDPRRCESVCPELTINVGNQIAKKRKSKMFALIY
jgi:hypothetical protein